MKILIAEDDRITRTSLARQLTSWGHEVVAADDGQQAWEHYSRTDAIAPAPAPFDLVITDWEMPRLSGVELVRRIREAPQAQGGYTYLIILTSRSDKADIVSGIEAGADDYLSKPFDKGELRVRLLAGERIVTLERTLSRQNSELQQANARIRSGLEAAARVQQSMLPREPIVTPRVCTAWQYVPCDELAGDAVGLYLVDDRYLVAYVLDVSGHGVPAALLSVSAMRALEPEPPESSFLRDLSLADGHLGTVARPARVATELSRRFRAGENDGRYLTMSLAVLDTHDGRLQLTSAGHPPALLVRDGRSIEIPDAGGFPIGMLDGGSYDDATINLRPGDRLCLYSDGVIEQFSPNGVEDQFGEERLLKHLIGHARAGVEPDRVVNDIVADVSRFSGGRAFSDDVSLVIVDWRGPGG